MSKKILIAPKAHFRSGFSPFGHQLKRANFPDRWLFSRVFGDFEPGAPKTRRWYSQGINTRLINSFHNYATLKIRGPTLFGESINLACSTQILEHFRDFRSCSSGARRARSAIHSPSGLRSPSAPQPLGGLDLVWPEIIISCKIFCILRGKDAF